MDKKTVLVFSRHPHLADVRKTVLEEAGYEVVAIGAPESIEEVCRSHKISLVLIGYSLSPAEKRRIAAEATSFCTCPSLELWDREPPQLRVGQPIFDRYSLKPGDFLDTVNTILDGSRQSSPLPR